MCIESVESTFRVRKYMDWSTIIYIITLRYSAFILREGLFSTGEGKLRPAPLQSHWH